MIIECPRCESRVKANVNAQKDYGPTEEAPPFKIYFLECPACEVTMIGKSELVQCDDGQWSYTWPTRLWPEPAQDFHISIPGLTRLSLEEARKCFGARAYSVCVVMCGKAIEGILVEYETKSTMLSAGLKELKDKQIIDQRLFNWGEALRKQRNIGAHATGGHIARQDARDTLDFAIAFCEYVFVLSQKYEQFQERQAKRTGRKVEAMEEADADASEKTA